MRSAVLALCAVLLWPAAALATTYLVRPDGTGDFPTIQSAIDASVSGDVIELAEGTFSGDGNRDLEFRGKSITVRSASGNPSDAIIDCHVEGHRGFWFRGGESPAAVLEAVTIANAFANQTFPWVWGGAILCAPGSCPTIRNCVFVNNRAYSVEQEAYGGAICSYEPGLVITGCWFEGNQADFGGAIFGDFALIRDCTFVGNEGLSLGGAIIAHLLEGAGQIESCTLVRNDSPHAAGIFFDGVPHEVRNTIVAFGIGGEALNFYNEMPTLVCCDLHGNAGGDWVGGIAGQAGQNGNLSRDPLFCGLESDDFMLHANSPCAPDSNPECGLIGAWPVGCGETPVEETTWGALKAMFRE